MHCNCISLYIDMCMYVLVLYSCNLVCTMMVYILHSSLQNFCTDVRIPTHSFLDEHIAKCSETIKLVNYVYVRTLYC